MTKQSNSQAKESLIREDLLAGRSWREISSRRSTSFSTISSIANSIKKNIPLEHLKLFNMIIGWETSAFLRHLTDSLEWWLLWYA